MSAHPETIGKYTVEGVLGEGAMGVVYKAFDPNIARPVAIKTIHKHLLSSEMGREMLQRFRTEAQAVGKLSHPNIVGIYDFDQEQGMPYFVMEFVEGKDLKSLLKSNELFPVEKIVSIISDVLQGLAYTHELGIVHRDIKPANIFITNKGQVKIADFGIARLENSELTQVGSVLGTPSYMSPEQCLGSGVDARSDLFSTGVMLYEMLTGVKPFQASAASIIIQNVVSKNPEPPSQYNLTLPHGFDNIIRKALAKNLNQRYQSAAEFREDLQKVLQGQHISRPATLPSRRILVTAGSVLVSTLLVGGGAWWYLSGPVEHVVAIPLNPTPVIKTDLGEIKPPSEPLTRLSQEDQAKVDRLLEVAQVHFKVGRLVSPEGSNALEAYRMVLDTDKNNEIALAGVEEVKRRFFRRANILWQQGQQDEARLHLELAEQVFNSDTETLALRQLIRGS
jgi:serine/threonine-protein kinase